MSDEGCAHYKRNSSIVATCCNKVYSCVLCHNELEAHKIKNSMVREIICNNCHHQQKYQLKCEKCSTIFGKYSCLPCKLFDNRDRQQFHCDGCGVCRIGGRENSFHCDDCKCCLPLSLQNAHKCVENMSRRNCAVCLESLHYSRRPCIIPKCSHPLHLDCFKVFLANQKFACPTCSVSLINMQLTWEQYDAEILRFPLSEDCKNQVDISCNDCNKKSALQFHFVGLKCQHCGSYNTRRISNKYVSRIYS